MRPSFHRRTDLALAALRSLVGVDEPMAGTRLAERVGTTVSFLPQVMAPLIRHGWVVSGRGPGGGYQLTVDAAAASLLDVVEATEGPAENGTCVLRPGPCPGAPPCAVHRAWVDAREVLTERFAQIPALETRTDP